jgi:O-antigen chain-terminating methyltransferase
MGTARAMTTDGLKAAIRRLLERALRPVLTRQAEIDAGLQAALDEARESLSRLEREKATLEDLKGAWVRLEELREGQEWRWAETATWTALGQLSERVENGLATAEGHIREVQAHLEAHQAAYEAESRRREGEASVEDLRTQIRVLQGLLEERNEALRRLASLDRAGLEDRLDRLERQALGTPGGADRPGGAAGRYSSPEAPPQAHGGEYGAIDYFSFEAQYRGSRADIRSRHEIYVQYLPAEGPILDIGCGRGELLEILKEKGIAAAGADLDGGMVAYCQGIGLDVRLQSGEAALGCTPAGALGGIFLGQVVEHMSPEQLLALLGRCFEKLRPGGVFIAETPNPLCQRALANFYIDPTHVRPVHPAMFDFFARSARFADLEFRFSSPDGAILPDLVSDDARPAGAELFQDYALICRKP